MPWLPVALVAVLVLGQASGAQSATGALTGIVTDEGGGVIPGASITVLTENPPRTIISNAAGRYWTEGLPAGVHRMEVKLAGFMTRRAEVQIVAGRETTWNVVIGIRSAHSRENPVGPDPTPPILAAAVYDAILRHVFKGEVPPRLLVVSTSLIQPFADDDGNICAEGVVVWLHRTSGSGTFRILGRHAYFIS